MADNKGKGCSFTQITKYVLKRENFDAFEVLLPKDELTAKISEALTPFIGADGKKTYHDAGIVYAMYKKVEKKKILIAIAIIKRVAGVAEQKKGLEALFANSPDTYELTEKFIVPDFREDEEFFDEMILAHLEDVVGAGQAKEATFGDTRIYVKEGVKGVSQTLYNLLVFAGMAFLWGTVFNSIALGLCFGLCFSTCFNLTTARAKTGKDQISQDGQTAEQTGEDA